MNVKPYEVVSRECAKRANKTEWGALAAALGELLYNADTYPARVDTDGGWYLSEKLTAEETSVRKFASPAQVYVSQHEAVRRLGIEGSSNDYVDVKKLLRLLMTKCEIEAVREVTR